MDLSQKTLRIACYGTGWWSRYQIPAWQEINGVEVCAVGNRTRSRAEVAAERFGISNVYTDAAEMIEKEKPDIFDIITEVPAHETLVEAGVRSGAKVIVCQKPMSYSLESCEYMVRICRDAGVKLFINENYRWQPPIRRVKKLIREGLIGKVFRCHISLSTGGPEQLENQPFLKTLRNYSLFDMGSHVFDIARFLFGEPDSVYCKALRTIETIAGDDYFTSVLAYKEMACTIEVTDLLSHKILVEGTNGMILLKADNTIEVINKHGTYNLGQGEWPKHTWATAEDEALLGTDCIHAIYSAQLDIINALRNSRLPESNGAENLKTMKIMFGAIESNKQGRVIPLTF